MFKVFKENSIEDLPVRGKADTEGSLNLEEIVSGKEMEFSGGGQRSKLILPGFFAKGVFF